MQSEIKLSIVSPVYRAEKIIPTLVQRIEEAVKPITSNYEIILVEDCGPDRSWEVIEKTAKDNKHIIGVKLSRNFGQHYAITAGLSYSTGDWTIVMDCDLQDQPEEIHKLYEEAQKGYDIVYARRLSRKDTFLKRLSSTIFHAIYRYFSGQKTDKAIANFGIYNKKVIAEFNKMKELTRSFPTLINYLGFKISAVEVEHASRLDGNSSYSLSKLLKLAFDSMLANSNKPLKITVKLGFSISSLSFLLAIYNIIAYFGGIIMVSGYTSTIFSIWFVGGLILFVLGVIGLYIGKIFDQVKGRPIFIVSEIINYKP